MTHREMIKTATVLLSGLLVSLSLAGCSRNSSPLVAAAASQPLFDFHSNLWVNLHHVLYEEALRRYPRRDGQMAPPLLTPAGLTPDELSAWETALTYYDNEFIKQDRDLLFDEGLRQINVMLSGQEGRAELDPAQLPVRLPPILQRAAPVYQKHWWPQHDFMNQKLVAGLAPQVAKYGPGLQQQLLTSYHSQWPGGAQQRLRVEIVYHANWAGAYTLNAPALITLASGADERTAGWRGLELLFHEASHPLIGQVSEDIGASAKRFDKAPGQLWHATLFFTTGEIVRRTLEKDGIADYIPYAYYNGLFAPDGPWSIYARALEKHWQPYLSGTAEYQQALTSLVSALPEQAEPAQ